MAKVKYPIHEDFKPLEPIPSSMIYKGWVRPLLRFYSKINFARAKAPSTIETSYHEFTAQDGGNIKLELYKPASLASKKLPLIIYYHGGGFMISPFNTHKETCWRYAEEVGAAVLFVRYRLTPENPFPIPFNDCYEALLWARENADNYNLDAGKISVSGDSAGGALAATVAQKAVDELGVGVLTSQVLVYPVLDNQCNTPSATELIGTPVWDAVSNKVMWQHYLGSNVHSANAPDYAVGAQYKTPEKLPLTYIENAEFDPLRDEAKNYADVLVAAGVDVNFHYIEGAVHGYDAEADSPISKKAFQLRVDTFKKGFAS